MLEKPLIGIGLGAQILALAAGGSVEATPLRFTLDTARRCVDGALNGYLPDAYPVAVYGRDRAVPPGYSQILARDSAGAPALWQVGANAFGFSGHPGLKVAMIEDLIMEFEETPADPVPDPARTPRGAGRYGRRAGADHDRLGPDDRPDAGGAGLAASASAGAAEKFDGTPISAGPSPRDVEQSDSAPWHEWAQGPRHIQKLLSVVNFNTLR